MRDLPRAARAYVLAVIGIGAGVLTWRTATGPINTEPAFIVLCVLSAILGSRTVALGQRAEMALSLPLILCALLRVGPNAAIDVSVVGMLSTCLLRRRPFPPHRTLFNVASLAIVTFASSRVYEALHDADQSFSPATYLLPLLAAVLTYYFINTSLVAGVIALSYGRPIQRVWKESFLWTLISYLAGGSIAVGMIHLLEGFGPYSLVLAVPPMLLIYYFYRLYIDRANERQKRIEEIERHNAMLESEVARRTQDLVELNERLRHSNEELKRVSRLKSEFLANMSHELRTPLNAIIGFSELLEESAFGGLNGDQLNFVRDIHASGTHLLSLINDILDLSKIEAGRMTLHREECDLTAILRETLTVVHPLALKKQLRVTTSAEARTTTIRVDAGKIKQVMYNLLSNAVKFTGEGGSVSVEALAKGADLVVSVADTGIGIPEADLGNIFEEFYQVDGSYTRRHEGTGLGLALVKRIVEMHGGIVSVESRPGQGSTFGFRLPEVICAPEEESDSAPAVEEGADAGDSDRLARGLILVVEDNPMNLRLTRSILASSGFGVVEARSGEEALRVLRDRRPDLILMDLQLPGVDGLTLTRMIHHDPTTRGIPTVALTACAMKGDEDRAREAGCVGYITKPVSAANLPVQVAAFLSARA